MVAVVLLISLFFASASMAAPVLPRAAHTIVDSLSTSLSASTSTTPANALPTPVFTLGPSGLPRVSATTASTTASRARLEMDWLS